MANTLSSRVTIKGQVTIPSAIRNLLGAKPGDVIEFESTGEVATIRVRKSRLMEFFGIGGELDPPMTDEELEEAFEQGVADEEAERMSQEF